MACQKLYIQLSRISVNDLFLYLFSSFLKQLEKRVVLMYKVVYIASVMLLFKWHFNFRCGF